jgi:hypothetical protein
MVTEKEEKTGNMVPGNPSVEGSNSPLKSKRDYSPDSITFNKQCY